jgi:hypothetical protein
MANLTSSDSSDSDDDDWDEKPESLAISTELDPQDREPVAEDDRMPCYVALDEDMTVHFLEVCFCRVLAQSPIVSCARLDEI